MTPTSSCLPRRPPATPRGSGFSDENILSCALVVSPALIIYAGGSLILQRLYNPSEAIKLIQPERIDYHYMFAFAESFPRNPAGKILKQELKMQLWEVGYGRHCFLNAVTAAPYGV
jgi:hypothetical protein